MFGLKHEFTYFQCAKCGCLQIVEIPNNLAEYYPKNYLSFDLGPVQYTKQTWLRKLVKAKRLDHFLGNMTLLGRAAHLLFGEPDIPDKWLKDIPLQSSYRMLDVGCGKGRRILQWRLAGFTDVMGVDAFIDSDIDWGNGVRILKRSLPQLHGEFDFISMIHSFEHMPDPQSVLKAAFEKLKSNRFLLIAIPISSSYAWEHYGTDWVSLDPPRHLFLHSERSMRKLAEEAGFRVAKVIYDSSAVQFWGSEQYRRDIPLMDEKRSYRQNREGSVFSATEIKNFEERSLELNRQCRGDRARFYLYKT